MAQDNSNSNSKQSSVRRCGQIGEGEEDCVTMIDFLNEQERLQADADAVLGGSDGLNCSYPKGYVSRQAVYACKTCTPEGNAGICLACVDACHEDHEVYELYTKRNFKCDCGNEKFSNNPCKIYKEKKELNSRNRYNQNFIGLYCTCSRPYPDEDDSIEDEMIQCIMCEDWYHGRHLNTEVPDSADYHEMICAACMCRYSFLWAYHVQCRITPIASDAPENGEEVDVGGSKNAPLKENTKCVNEAVNTGTTNGKNEPSSSSPSGSKCGKRKAGEDDLVQCAKKIKGDKTAAAGASDEENGCLLKSLQQRSVDQPDCGAFWSEGWRTKLCKCTECMEMYEDKNVLFLLDESDTMQAYEAKGSANIQDEAERVEASREAEAEADRAAFNAMGRVQQIEVVRGMMDLKTELNEFLQGIAREGKVVQESDIREFFQRMEQRRRDRMHVQQNNCR